MALRSAYDYYPFGMLMPGRYVSDTSQHCVTVTRPTWVWKEVTVAYWDVYAWEWPSLELVGEATAKVDGDAVEINAPNASDAVGYTFPVTPNVQQTLTLDIERINLNDKAYVEVLEQQGKEWVTLAETPVEVSSGGLEIPFKPSGSQIRVVWHGRILVWVRRDCISKLEWVEEDQLVTICDGDKDKYRFGFNGQEKVNEWAGTGNYLDFGARGLDTRTGRWIAKDPLAVKYPFESPYSLSLNSPICAKDPDGKVVIFINGQHLGEGGKSDYWRVYKNVTLGIRGEKDGFGQWHDSYVSAKREVYAFDKAVMNRIGDHKAIYRDGSSGGFKNTLLTWNNMDVKYREASGVVQGMKDAKGIISDLQRNKDGKITESIKIISHSMGGAYAKGYAFAILNYAKENNIKGVKIEYEVDFAPFQPNMQKAVNGVRTIQVDHKYDKVVNNVIGIGGSHEAKEKGVENEDYHLNTTDKEKGHSIYDYSDEINSTVPKSNNNPQK